MWKAISRFTDPGLKLVSGKTTSIEQIRTTFILKRRYPVPLNSKGRRPKPLKYKHYVYDFVKDTNIEKQPNIDVLLTSYVDGVGNPGDKVSVSQNYGYNELLLPKLAVYATPENLEKYKNIIDRTDVVKYSSPQAHIIAKMLGAKEVSVIMNKENPWTLKPWHVRASFRKCGIVVPEEAIELPPQPIKGPDMNIQEQAFYVIITINKTEKVKVRCRIHHWSTEIVDRIPHVHEFWKTPNRGIHPEFEEVLAELPSKAVEQPTQSEVL